MLLRLPYDTAWRGPGPIHGPLTMIESRAPRGSHRFATKFRNSVGAITARGEVSTSSTPDTVKQGHRRVTPFKGRRYPGSSVPAVGKRLVRHALLQRRQDRGRPCRPVARPRDRRQQRTGRRLSRVDSPSDHDRVPPRVHRRQPRRPLESRSAEVRRARHPLAAWSRGHPRHAARRRCWSGGRCGRVYLTFDLTLALARCGIADVRLDPPLRGRRRLTCTIKVRRTASPRAILSAPSNRVVDRDWRVFGADRGLFSKNLPSRVT